MRIVHSPLPKQLAEPLSADEIHVWHLHRAPDAGRAPLLALLGAQLGIAPADVTLVTGEHGRPQLDPASGNTLDFNWSHSGDRALVALARGVKPGIDIELRRVRLHALELARRFFTAAEADWLASLGDTAVHAAFLQLWTAREAVLKATGRGISFGLDRLAFRCADGVPVLQHLDGEQVSAWQVHAIDVGDDAFACLAWRGSARRIRHFQLVDDV